MSDIWFRSDDHFGHDNTWKLFKKHDGTPLRPFSSSEEMNEFMVEAHNALVKPTDRVYFLGDVVINRKFLDIIPRLNGRKKLVLGNHDIYDNKYYHAAGFEQLSSYRVYVDQFICSHIPLHPDCVTVRYKGNLHGHLHGNVINDPKYLNVSVEQIGFAPINIDQVMERFQSNQKLFDETGKVRNYAD